MPVSVAKLSANRLNALRSTGPKTLEGKAVSRRNGLKHGLSGQGVVLPQGDTDKIARRNQILQAELSPKSALGEILVGQLAVLSVQMERAAKQESAALSTRVRHAGEAFDEERYEQAKTLFSTLADDPRENLRKLRKSPEGIAQLLQAWRDLRDELTREFRPMWTTNSLAMAANLLGLTAESLNGTRLDALRLATAGYFGSLPEAERPSETEAGKVWARLRLVERIDAEIAGLETHLATIDRSMIALDRAEAGDRALFDPSREACLARRYESESRRSFFKALNEFREVEAEVVEREDVEETPRAAEIPPDLGSSRETRKATICEPKPEPAMAARPARSREMASIGPRKRSEAVVRSAVPVG